MYDYPRDKTRTKRRPPQKMDNSKTGNKIANWMKTTKERERERENVGMKRKTSLWRLHQQNSRKKLWEENLQKSQLALPDAELYMCSENGMSFRSPDGRWQREKFI